MTTQLHVSQRPTLRGLRLTIDDYAVRLEAAPRAEVHNASTKVINMSRGLGGATHQILERKEYLASLATQK